MDILNLQVCLRTCGSGYINNTRRQGRRTVDPSLIHRWSIIDPLLIHRWSIVDPSLIHRWFIVDPSLIHRWSIVDPSLIHRWSVVDKACTQIFGGDNHQKTKRPQSSIESKDLNPRLQRDFLFVKKVTFTNCERQPRQVHAFSSSFSLFQDDVVLHVVRFFVCNTHPCPRRFLNSLAPGLHEHPCP